MKNSFFSSRISLKKKLCEENLLVLSIIDPGLSTARGRTLFEVSTCDFYFAKLNYESGRIDRSGYLELVRNCALLLEESKLSFEEENPRTIEKFFEDSVDMHLQHMHYIQENGDLADG